ncbi:MAG TPA: outer membrane protein assembly factor BamE [Syntrophorhabdaceae bacterium]|jgi:hypothetical protein
MDTHKTIIGFILCCSFLIGLAGCGGSVRVGDNAPRYLTSNIHAQQQEKEMKASYANWTNPGAGHVIIPVNTPVIVDTVRRDLSIVTRDTNKTIYFEFDEGKMGMTNAQYINIIASPQPTNLNHLSAVDRKGINEGKVYTGMTKEGVRIALGYPAVHKTPSLNSNTWYYWTNRWKSFAVQFDNTGKVSTVIK